MLYLSLAPQARPTAYYQKPLWHCRRFNGFTLATGRLHDRCPSLHRPKRCARTGEPIVGCASGAPTVVVDGIAARRGRLARVEVADVLEIHVLEDVRSDVALLRRHLLGRVAIPGLGEDLRVVVERLDHVPRRGRVHRVELLDDHLANHHIVGEQRRADVDRHDGQHHHDDGAESEAEPSHNSSPSLSETHA